MSMSNKTRIAVERCIVSKLIDGLAAVGFVPHKVWDGGDYQDTRTKAAALEAVFSVDESTLHFAPKGARRKWGRFGVLLIGGNGEDVISDWHCGDPAFDAGVSATASHVEDVIRSALEGSV